jgi:predicted metal-dependent phosphoesterase TrpH
VEFSGMYTKLTGQFNRRAARYARTSGLPVVGDTDTHFLWQLGYTYTLIDAAPEPTAVVDAVRRGRVRLVTRPLGWANLLRFIVRSQATGPLLWDSLRYMVRIVRRTRGALQQAPHPQVSAKT